jgi:3-hydroxybutyryl-CoA dehydrogenase
MHFFNPPQIMKLVEVVKTKKTSQAIVSRIEKVSKALGKIPIIISDYPGFVANRIGISVFSEASVLLEKGIANVRDIDLSIRLGYGYPLGPFELGDLVGLDARLRNMIALYRETGDEKFRPPKILRRLVAEGYLGEPKLKPESRGGYYEYFGLKRPSEV